MNAQVQTWPRQPCKHRWHRKDDYDLCIVCGAKDPSPDTRCERCHGDGRIRPLPFAVPPVYIECPDCGGTGRKP